jgi:hypothetical protein
MVRRTLAPFQFNTELGRAALAWGGTVDLSLSHNLALAAQLNKDFNLLPICLGRHV